MKKLFMAAAAAAVVVGAGVVTAPVASASPLRYYTTFYGGDTYSQCIQRGNQGLRNGEWWDYQCRLESYGSDLYIQISPN
ncbi:hypothetical protein [Kribbella sp. NPDC051770]|uniref:hypothetical protein n=1 Tax=Kribbella sp. NPDC051770 TaxID=3155413 RepID=UPI00341F87D9